MMCALRPSRFLCYFFMCVFADTSVSCTPAKPVRKQPMRTCLVFCCILYCFWATICKTVRPMLSDHCPVCLSVCNVGVLWPNCSMDQDETWRGGRSRPRPHCVRRGPISPEKGHSSPPQFSTHVCCGQTAEWIKMPLGVEVGLGPG